MFLETSAWGLCAQEGNTTENNSTVQTLFLENLQDDFIPGEYRLVIFVGDKVVYAQFSVTE